MPNAQKCLNRETNGNRRCILSKRVQNIISNDIRISNWHSEQ